ncbi:STAS domain-containing protein [Mycobacterium sp. NPDC048908]|uniref:STAS domain-containing protein n=1 Tax=Mycobacterium sp. NPDC048908 TaxID=3364292 RepID=UPI0037160396
MATLITVSTSRGPDGQIVVTVAGELDLSNLDRFTDAVAGALDQADGRPVRLDLQGIEYLDSGAINALFACGDRVHVVVNPILMPVLKISGITDVMSVVVGG